MKVAQAFLYVLFVLFLGQTLEPVRLASPKYSILKPFPGSLPREMALGIVVFVVFVPCQTSTLR